MRRGPSRPKSSSKAASHGQTYFRKTMMLKMVCALILSATAAATETYNDGGSNDGDSSVDACLSAP